MEMSIFYFTSIVHSYLQQSWMILSIQDLRDLVCSMILSILVDLTDLFKIAAQLIPDSLV